jgi:hypothetical protein
MVRAILAGRKTVTRRVAKVATASTPRLSALSESVIEDEHGRPIRPPAYPGDRLWVRESWFPDPPIDGTWDGDIQWNGCGRPIDGVPEHYRSPQHCIFKASWSGTDLQWRPSIHMPRWASRLILEVKALSIRRLSHIDEADAQREGMCGPLLDPELDELVNQIGVAPSEAFRSLWDALNAKRGFGWDVNPWVWRIEFAPVGGARG